MIDDYTRLPSAPDEDRVTAPRAGTWRSCARSTSGARRSSLGAGRARLEDAVDHGVGISVDRAAGDRGPKPETPCSSSAIAAAADSTDALPMLQQSLEIHDSRPSGRPLVVDSVA